MTFFYIKLHLLHHMYFDAFTSDVFPTADAFSIWKVTTFI